MQVGVVREAAPGERRVAVAPDTVARFQKLGFTVAVEHGAGVAAGFTDAAYEQAGASLVSREDAWNSDVVVKIDAPTTVDGVDEVGLLKPGALFVSLLDPARNGELLARLAAARVTAIALERVPRITRAQKMDVLSSMANIAGYRAVIEAANAFGSFFTPQMTAAGKSPPARVLIIGAGVAGLAAIGAARSLGAEVRAFDVRAACREQVESMGARFLEVKLEEEESGETAGGYAKVMSDEFIAAEMALFAQQAAEVDIIITTALIPGKPAPRLITEEMVAAMKPGSVVVDLAAATGGNCAGTVAGEIVDVGGVTIIGLTDLPSRMARVASRFFGSNLAHLLDEQGGAARLEGDAGPVDLEDEVFHQSTVVLQGAVRWPIDPFPKKAPPPPPPPEEAATPAPSPAAAPAAAPAAPVTEKKGATWRNVGMLAAAVALTAVGMTAPGALLQHLTVFVLACFVGWQLIWNVTPALHTPLMSVTNAISGIIIIGGMLQASRGGEALDAAVWIGTVAILLASINIAGGFLVTQRMLRMFHR